MDAKTTFVLSRIKYLNFRHEAQTSRHPMCAWERNKKTESTTHHIFLSVKWGVSEATSAPYSASIV